MICSSKQVSLLTGWNEWEPDLKDGLVDTESAKGLLIDIVTLKHIRISSSETAGMS